MLWRAKRAPRRVDKLSKNNWFSDPKSPPVKKRPFLKARNSC
jgi:hypothetical protein